MPTSKPGHAHVLVVEDDRKTAGRPGQVLTRRQLLRHLPTPGGPPLDRTVDVHVRNVRRKLERVAGAAHPDAGRLEAVHGVGYRVAADEGTAPGGGSPKSSR